MIFFIESENSEAVEVIIFLDDNFYLKFDFASFYRAFHQNHPLNFRFFVFISFPNQFYSFYHLFSSYLILPLIEYFLSFTWSQICACLFSYFYVIHFQVQVNQSKSFSKLINLLFYQFIFLIFSVYQLLHNLFYLIHPFYDFLLLFLIIYYRNLHLNHLLFSFFEEELQALLEFILPSALILAIQPSQKRNLKFCLMMTHFLLNQCI